MKQVTARKVQELDEKIAELEKIRMSLKTLHTACCGGPESAEHCSILQALDSMEAS